MEELFRRLLIELINGNHPLVKLAEWIDWSVFEREWASLFPLGRSRPASLEKVIVDTTVMENTIAYRTDSRLPERTRQYLVKLAGVLGCFPVPELQPQSAQAGGAGWAVCPHQTIPAHEGQFEILAHAAWAGLV